MCGRSKSKALAGAALLLAGCAAPALSGGAGPVGAPEGHWRQQTHMIPLRQADGTERLLLGRVCRPEGESPSRVVVIAHGSPAVASERPRMTLSPCDGEAAQWFLARGYVLVFSLRRGYGGTGGTYVEGNSECTAEDYVRQAGAAAQDVSATVDYALALPFARHDGAVVVGQSAGGWAAVGLDSVAHPKVAALVSMAGGRGGHVGNQANVNCHPENLAAAAGQLGRTAATPMLWVFTENDSYFAPPIAASMHAAFTAGGGRAELHALPAYGSDGHRLFFGSGGSRIWGPLVKRYLAERGAG